MRQKYKYTPIFDRSHVYYNYLNKHIEIATLIMKRMNSLDNEWKDPLFVFKGKCCVLSLDSLDATFILSCYLARKAQNHSNGIISKEHIVYNNLHCLRAYDLMSFLRPNVLHKIFRHSNDEDCFGLQTSIHSNSTLNLNIS